MANFWLLWDGGDNTHNSGSAYTTWGSWSWANAYDDITTVAALMAAGDILLIASDHTEGTGGLSFSLPGTIDAQTLVYTIDRTTNAYEPWRDSGETAANFVLTDSGADLYVTSGFVIWHGISIEWHDVLAASVFDNESSVFVDCDFIASGAGSTDIQAYTNYGRGYIEFRNCVFSKDESTDALLITADGRVNFLNCSVSVSEFRIAVGTRGKLFARFINCDLSGISTPATAICQVSGVNYEFYGEFSGCTFASGQVLTDGAPEYDNAIIESYGSDSAGFFSRYERHTRRGAITTDTGVYRTAGAEDKESGNGFSFALTPSAYFQGDTVGFKFPVSRVYNTTTGSSVTAEVHFADDLSSALLNDAVIWCEFSYLPTNESTARTVVSTRGSVVPASGNGGALTTTTGLWTGSPTRTFKFSESFTPNEEGWIEAQVFVEGVDLSGQTSNSIYVCPKIELS